jgi:AmmeMemoRadiSam system protein B
MKIRQPAVAGSFYPGDSTALATAVDRYLASGRARLETAVVPKALIAPHAGYIYSGPVAGTAYAAAAAAGARIRRVVVIGPAHRVPVDGVAAPSDDAFATPLGEIAIDHAVLAPLRRRAAVEVLDAAHAGEHSLEVQLPFLQRVFGAFALVPLAVGATTHEAVAAVLDELWGGDDTLIVISSDLSHYYDYDTARALDEATARAVERLDATALGPDSACGRIPIGGMLLAARQRGLQARRLDLRNSGDTAGPRNEVVGYGAFAFSA